MQYDQLSWRDNWLYKLYLVTNTWKKASYIIQEVVLNIDKYNLFKTLITSDININQNS